MTKLKESAKKEKLDVMKPTHTELPSTFSEIMAGAPKHSGGMAGHQETDSRIRSFRDLKK